MADDIGNLIDGILGAVDRGAARIAHAAWSAVRSVWNTATDFWHRIGNEHSFLSDIFHDLRNEAQNFLGHVYTGLRWIIGTLIPQVINGVINTVVSWVQRAISVLESTIQGWVKSLLEWATKAFNILTDGLSRLERWAIAQVGAIYHDLRAVADVVNHFLTSPDVLVGWLWDALWRKTRDFVRTHEEAFARWLLAHAVSGAVKLADIIESIIINIL